jgi:hypothetical protein
MPIVETAAAGGSLVTPTLIAEVRVPPGADS